MIYKKYREKTQEQKSRFSDRDIDLASTMDMIIGDAINDGLGEGLNRDLMLESMQFHSCLLVDHFYGDLSDEKKESVINFAVKAYREKLEKIVLGKEI